VAFGSGYVLTGRSRPDQAGVRSVPPRLLYRPARLEQGAREQIRRVDAGPVNRRLPCVPMRRDRPGQLELAGRRHDVIPVW